MNEEIFSGFLWNLNEMEHLVTVDMSPSALSLVTKALDALVKPFFREEPVDGHFEQSPMKPLYFEKEAPEKPNYKTFPKFMNSIDWLDENALHDHKFWMERREGCTFHCIEFTDAGTAALFKLACT